MQDNAATRSRAFACDQLARGACAGRERMHALPALSRTRHRPCRARGADMRISCWSASSRATRKTSPASRSSGRPGGCSTRRWRRREFRASEVFVTNAVKHFKHEMRGKRRLHKRPNSLRDRALQDLARHRARIVKPAAIVALGATAARSLLGRAGHHREGARQSRCSLPTARPPS